MKTYEQLMKHYWGVIVPMAEAAGIDPWECVRIYGAQSAAHPSFSTYPYNYTFAITIIEERAVFVGDEVYGKVSGDEFDWDNWNDIDINGMSQYYTWTPPTKKRTFTLGDKELPCPIVKNPTDNFLHIGTVQFQFNNREEMLQVRDELTNILFAARDKE